MAAALSAHVDLEGRRICHGCFEHLIYVEKPDGTYFRCGICGKAASTQNIQYVSGIDLCGVCAGKTESPDEVPQALNPAIPQDGGSPELSIDIQTIKKLPPLPEFTWPPAFLREVTCPHCWHVFPPQEVLHVSQHSELMGDPIAGDDAQLRFKASRFDTKGNAIDLYGVRCQHLACPKCHLIIPRALLHIEPMILSIIGAPASGKSHFLAAMTWEIRRVFAEHFGIAFNDADPDFNRALNEYEETLFLPPHHDQLVAIRKTDLQGELYDRIRIGSQTITLPRPFLFSLRYPESADPSVAGKMRVLCMYDNAGEHFQPGMDTASAPGTQHLSRSRLLMFIFDPTQHPRLREQCRQVSDDPQLEGSVPTSRQETILLEAVTRIRRHAGLDSFQKHDKPLLVLVSKADVWGPLAGIEVETEPLVLGNMAGTPAALDMRRVQRTSAQVREFISKHAPNLLTAAEDAFQHVLYIPVSSLGSAPTLDAVTGMLAVRSSDVKPRWVTVPLMYVLASAKGGGVSMAQSHAPESKDKK